MNTITPVELAQLAELRGPRGFVGCTVELEDIQEAVRLVLACGREIANYRKQAEAGVAT